MMIDLMVMVYLLKEDKQRMVLITLERASWREFGEKWAIRMLGHCLNKDGKWEYEPMPSSRDDEFFKRCRWGSAEEAIEFWNKHPDSK